MIALAPIFAALLGAAPSIDDCRFAGEVQTTTRAGTSRWLARDALFRPLMAHPREPRFATGVLHGWGNQRRVLGWVSAGGAWSIYVDRPSDGCDGLSVGLDGGVHAQFDLSTPSRGLVNADYVVGLPVTWRRGAWSGRLRLQHQSSHLGDEFLLSHPETARENLSFELLEVLFALDVEEWRVYAGAAIFLRSLPRFERGTLHSGLELRTRRWWEEPGGLGLRGVLAVDVELMQLRGWDPAVSGKIGIELERPEFGVWRTLLVGYQGFEPFGQFFDEARISTLGVESAYHF